MQSFRKLSFEDIIHYKYEPKHLSDNAQIKYTKKNSQDILVIACLNVSVKLSKYQYAHTQLQIQDIHSKCDCQPRAQMSPLYCPVRRPHTSAPISIVNATRYAS